MSLCCCCRFTREDETVFTAVPTSENVLVDVFVGFDLGWGEGVGRGEDQFVDSGLGDDDGRKNKMMREVRLRCYNK